MAFTINHGTLSNMTDGQIRKALAQLTRPAGTLAEILRGELLIREEMAAMVDEDGSDAYVRHLEMAGYDEARFQEEMEARNGVIPFHEALEEASLRDAAIGQIRTAGYWDEPDTGAYLRPDEY
jgi:hypothetical protein